MDTSDSLSDARSTSLVSDTVPPSYTPPNLNQHQKAQHISTHSTGLARAPTSLDWILRMSKRVATKHDLSAGLFRPRLHCRRDPRHRQSLLLPVCTHQEIAAILGWRRRPVTHREALGSRSAFATTSTSSPRCDEFQRFARSRLQRFGQASRYAFFCCGHNHRCQQFFRYLSRIAMLESARCRV